MGCNHQLGCRSSRLGIVTRPGTAHPVSHARVLCWGLMSLDVVHCTEIFWPVAIWCLHHMYSCVICRTRAWSLFFLSLSLSLALNIELYIYTFSYVCICTYVCIQNIGQKFPFLKLDDDPKGPMVAASKDWQLRDRIESLLAGESVGP